MRLYIFGDSIMRGILYDPNARKYVMNSGIARDLDLGDGVEVVNNSRFGCVITKGAKKIDSALDAGSEMDYAVLEYGGNDCDFKWEEIAAAPDSEHRPNTPLETFKSVYAQIIDKLRRKNVEPILMTLPPIDAEKYFARITSDGKDGKNILKWLGDVQMIYRYQELYSNAIKDIGARMGCVVADVREAFLDKHNYRELMCDDGIHPNGAGHRLIASVLKKTVAGLRPAAV